MLISASGSKPCIQVEKFVKHAFNNSILSFKTILIQFVIKANNIIIFKVNFCIIYSKTILITRFLNYKTNFNIFIIIYTYNKNRNICLFNKIYILQVFLSIFTKDIEICLEILANTVSSLSVLIIKLNVLLTFLINTVKNNQQI